MGPHYLASRPLRYLPGGQGVDSAEQMRVLFALNTLEAGDLPRGDGDNSSPELQALQGRMDLLLLLVGQLSQQLGQGTRPAAVPVQIAAEAIEWQAAEALVEGEGVLELHLHEACPQPLRLGGTLQASGTEGRYRFCPQLPDPDAADAWERHIFRHHRRAVARKQQSAVDPPSS